MSHLHALSRRLGIVDEYIDQSGTERRPTSDRTRVALLAAMGVDGSSERECAAEVSRLAYETRRHLLPAVAVESIAGASRLEIRGGRGRWKLRIRIESGDELTHEGDGEGIVDLGSLPIGYHEIQLERGGEVGTQRRIVTPERCPSVAEVTGAPRAFGIVAQLYAIRSRANWGVGDCGDIDLLVDRAAAWGAAFVGLNPLHALRNQGAGISPYSPVSRLFGNWLCIALPGVPEHDGVEPAAVATLRAEKRVDYDRCAATKREALLRAYRRFLERGTPERRAAFEAYLAQRGRELQNFATFSVMSRDERATHDGPEAAGVQTFQSARRDEILFECWLQFELDRQLTSSSRRARDRGLAIGLYQDLAIGCAPDGSDVWSHPDLFARAAAIGAPPDSYSKEGQNWGLPPIIPQRLREDGYRYWSTLLQHAFAHGGALRMDHVIGLFRQFWIPAGMSGKEGAFVAFPADDLLGIVALEATRAGAVVVGEDLGTVPAEVPGVLARRGVLSSRVLYFETKDGEFNASSDYAENALTTANTHDMAPIAGWLDAVDIDLRARVGILDEAGRIEALAARKLEKAALRRRLAVENGAGSTAEERAIPAAVHEFLARTPSALVGISLDDVIGETEPVNVPGTNADQHPSWRRRYSVELEALPDAPDALPRALCERGR